MRIFITKLASKKNIELDFNVPTEVENLNASIASVNGNIKPLIELLNKCIVK
ncbi:hypothetical protein FACS189459_5260 [Bacilli bacterium]|nr:hypothetical protein FACS189459_5260 [Bacilli bacterium]